MGTMAVWEKPEATKLLSCLLPEATKLLTCLEYSNYSK